MPKMLFTIPEGRFSDSQIVAVQAEMVARYQHLMQSNDAVLCFWSVLPQGQSYVAGQQDDIYIALIEVPENFNQEHREELLLKFNEAFAEAAGISLEKPLITMADSSKVDEYLSANRNRLKSFSKLSFLIGTMVHAYRSKKQHGFAALPTNL
ncbi:MAG: hypothetical protein AAF431_04665 [Pseudomonadota bacterium]